MRKPLTHVLSFQVFLFLFFLFLSLFSGFIKYKEPFFGLFGAQESRILPVKDGTTKEDTWRLFIGWRKTSVLRRAINNSHVFSLVVPSFTSNVLHSCAPNNPKNGSLYFINLEIKRIEKEKPGKKGHALKAFS